jgi:hypothetical protein
MTMTSNYIPYPIIVCKTHLSPTKLPRSDVLSTFAVGMAWVTSTEDIELVFDIDAGSKRLFRIKTKDAGYGYRRDATSGKTRFQRPQDGLRDGPQALIPRGRVQCART